MVQMACRDLRYTLHKQVTNVSQHVFVILLWGILTTPLITHVWVKAYGDSLLEYSCFLTGLYKLCPPPHSPCPQPHTHSVPVSPAAPRGRGQWGSLRGHLVVITGTTRPPVGATVILTSRGGTGVYGGWG